MPFWGERSLGSLMHSHLVHHGNDAREIDGWLQAALGIEGIRKRQGHLDGADVAPVGRLHILGRLVAIGTARGSRAGGIQPVLNRQVLYAGYQWSRDRGIGGQAP